MALVFPSNPSVNDTYQVNGRIYVWNGTVWRTVKHSIPTTVPSLNVTGDLTGDTDTLYVDSTNNRVGVGTTTPTTALDVDGTITATSISAPLTGNVTGDVSGNAGTATKLESPRTVSLSGDVTGSVSFDGSADVDITATIADDSHNHIIGNIDGLQTAIDGKLDSTANAVSATQLETARTISLTGNVTGSATFDGTANASISSTIANNSVTNARLRDSAGLSVIGRSSSTAGDPADIAAGTDGHVLRRSGSSVSFGQIVAAGIANSTITKDKMAAGTLEVLQVVRSSYGQMITSSSGYVNTGLSASISPTSSSNKIGIFVYLNIYDAGTGNTVYFRMLRSGSTILNEYVGQANLPADSTSGLTILKYDAPATTSSRTYTLQVRSNNGTAIGAPLNSGEIWLFEFAM